MTREEEDFPPGHPARFDYHAHSTAAWQWAEAHYSPKGERDFARGHPKAVDTPGNQNHLRVLPGIDPLHPELEEFSGRTPAQQIAHRELLALLAAEAEETEPRDPIEAPPPPEPIDRPFPSGQPGE